MKKVVCYLLLVLVMSGICITFINNYNYNIYKKKCDNLKKELIEEKKHSKKINTEEKSTQEQLNNLKIEKKDRIGVLEEWQKINQEIINSLS